MSGHSKWANIKHRKSAVDSKRAKVFTKIAKEISIAARSGGDPDMNPSLRLILQKARAANMPNKNVERAIARGTGEIEGGELLEIVYEGYGPHGIGIVVEVVTDNRNRAVSDLRHALNKGGGSMAEAGAVTWQFTRKGVVTISESQVDDQDELFLIVADAGADDIEWGDPTQVYCDLDYFQAVQEALTDAGVAFDEVNVIYDPNNPVDLDQDDAMQVLKLIDALEDLDDVQNVYSALNITDEAMEAMMA